MFSTIASPEIQKCLSDLAKATNCCCVLSIKHTFFPRHHRNKHSLRGANADNFILGAQLKTFAFQMNPMSAYNLTLNLLYHSFPSDGLVTSWCISGSCSFYECTPPLSPWQNLTNQDDSHLMMSQNIITSQSLRDLSTLCLCCIKIRLCLIHIFFLKK